MSDSSRDPACQEPSSALPAPGGLTEPGRCCNRMAEGPVEPGANSFDVRPAVYRGAIGRRLSLKEKLQQGLGRRLIVVQAGTGYGKSCFLSEFAQANHGTSNARIAWLTLERMHLDRVHLLVGLIYAMQAVAPGVGGMTLDVLRKSRDAIRRWDYFLGLFCEEVSQAENRPSLLILDQYERVEASSSARQIVDRLIQALPSDVSILISTRRSPDLASMSQLKAGNNLFEVSSSDLCFTKLEIRAALSSCMGVTPSKMLVDSLMSRTGGWPAVIQIAGVVASHLGEKALLAFTGPDAKFCEYVCTEAFELESAGASPYLMMLSLVDRVESSLTEWLSRQTGFRDTPAGAGRERLPGLVADTENGLRYCHNPVFRSFVLQEVEAALPEEESRGLNLGLAEYYEGIQHWDASICHFLKASEYQRASGIIRSVAEDTITTSKLETLARWIDAFPERELRTRPWLLLYRGLVCRLELQWDTALDLYNQAADIFRDLGERAGLARSLWLISQVLAYRHNQRLAITLAEEALTYLGTAEDRARAWILHNMGRSYFDLCQANDALASHESSRDLFRKLGDTQGELLAIQAIGLVLHRLGRFNEAQQYYVDGLELQARTGDINMLCWLQAGLSHLRGVRGDYQDSVSGLKEIIEIAHRHDLRPAEAFARSKLVDVYMDLGNLAEAADCCRKALTVIDGREDGTRISVHLKLVALEAREGQRDTDLDDRMTLSIAEWAAIPHLGLTRISHDLLRASLSLSKHRVEEAEQLAEEARSLAARVGARYHEAQATYLVSRVLFLRGDLDGSARLVGELVAMVKEEGYVGFLLRDGQATRELLSNGFRRSSTREDIMELFMKLASIEEDSGAALMAGEATASADEPPSFRNETDAHASGRVNGTAVECSDLSVTMPAPALAFSAGQVERKERSLEVLVLGPMTVGWADNPITDRAWRTTKAKELFAYLLTRSDHSATRDELLDVLWPELGADSAVSNFHFTVHSLRHALEPELPPRSGSKILVLDVRQYRLELPGQTRVDLDEFKTSLALGRQCLGAREFDKAASLLERGTGLYRGDYLTDFYVDWADPTRREIRRRYIHALRQLARLAFVRQDYQQVLKFGGTMLKFDAYREDAHRLMMRAECETGNPALALRRFDELARLLKQELRTQPEASTRTLCRRIREGTYKRRIDINDILDGRKQAPEHQHGDRALLLRGR